MTTYKEIFGKYVKNYSSDPSSDAEGQVWYNTTSGTFKSVLAAGAWSAGGNMGTTRRNLAGAGTQTVGLAMGGYTGTAVTAATEEYDGSAWTAGGNMGTARYNLAGCGIQTAGLAFGGQTTTPLANTEEYDGSAWTAGGNLGTAKYLLGTAGTQTSALGFGGYLSPGASSSSEEYDGTSWTAGGSMAASGAGNGCGTQTAALGFGQISITQLYNGTSWATTASLATVRSALGSCGTQAAGLGAGGYVSSGNQNFTGTEEYSEAALAVKTITTSTS